MSKRTVYRAIWIPSALLCAAMGVVFARTPLILAKPGPMVRYSLNDKSLSIKHPGNWKAHVTGSHGVQAEITFEPGADVHVSVLSDLEGSLKSDIAKSSDAQMENLTGMLPGGGQEASGGREPARKKSPLEKYHEAMLASMKEEHEGFKVGKTHPTKLAGYEALVTEFTLKGDQDSNAGEIQGQVTTALASDSALRALCMAPKERYADLKPTFTEMIESLQAGGNGGGR